MKYHHKTAIDLLERCREYLPADQVAQIAETIQNLQSKRIPLEAFQQGIDSTMVLAKLKLGTPTLLAGLFKPVCQQPGFQNIVPQEALGLALGASKLDEIENKKTPNNHTQIL